MGAPKAFIKLKVAELPTVLLKSRTIIRAALHGVKEATGLCSMGRRNAVDEEFRKNKELGERLGCWRSSYLVEDDAGSVRRALQELKQAPEQGGVPAADAAAQT